MSGPDQPTDPAAGKPEPTPEGPPRFRLRPITDEDVTAPPPAGLEGETKPADAGTGPRFTLPDSARRRDTAPPMPQGPDQPPPGSAGPPPRKHVDYFTRRMRWWDLPVAIALACLAFLAVALTYRGFGHSWDEALYWKGATRAAEWVARLAGGEAEMLAPETVEKYWGVHADGEDLLHPEVGPVPKLVTGLGARLLGAHGFDPMVASRLPVAMAFGLTVALLYWIGTRAWGRGGGTTAALAYLLFPRVFGHAHIAASETLLAFVTVLTVACFLAGIRRWPLGLLTGLAFGLALGTKFTALLLPLPLLLWGQAYYRRDYSTNIFSMILLAPLAVLAIWPWLWNDTGRRIAEYMEFYLRHQSTAVFYMGRVHGYVHGPPAPWHYPLVTLLVSLPEWALALGMAGLVRTLWRPMARPVPVLFLLLAAAPLALSSLPGAPKYDGERLFFSAFPFIALLVGGGLAGIVSRLTRGLERSARGGFQTLAVAALVVWGVADLMLVHPNQLNYFNRASGGAEGAAGGRFETCYWGEALNEPVLDWLNANTRKGTRVKTLALNELAFQNLQTWGKLPLGVDFTPGDPPYDYIILQARQGMMGRAERALFTAHKPVASFDAQGVPRILVYAGDALGGPPPAATAARPGAADAATTGSTSTATADPATTTPVPLNQ